MAGASLPMGLRWPVSVDLAVARPWGGPPRGRLSRGGLKAATCPGPRLRAGPQRLSARSGGPLPAAESSLCCFKHLFPISKIRLVRKISLGCLNFYQGLQRRGGEGGEAVGFPNQDRLLQSKTLFKGKRERTEGGGKNIPFRKHWSRCLCAGFFFFSFFPRLCTKQLLLAPTTIN